MLRRRDELEAAVARHARRGALEDRAQDDLHLHRRERRAEAAPAPAAEGDPRVGARRLRRGSARDGRRRARGRSPGRGGRGRRWATRQTPGGVAPPADLDLLHDQPRRGVGQHGPAAQGLLHRRGQVGVAVAAGDLARSAASSTAGVRTRRSNAKASCDAVVSWPATSSVISSSRSSCGAHRRAVLVARARAAARGRRRARAPSRRRSSMSAKSSRVDRARAVRRKRRPRRAGPEVALQRREQADAGWRRRRAGRSGARAGARAARPSSRPKTVRRMTSSVSACRRGCRATGSPRGQRSTSRCGDLGHRPRSARATCSPWKAGSMSRRWAQVGVLVEQDHRVAARSRGSRMRAPLAGVQDLRRAP